MKIIKYGFFFFFLALPIVGIGNQNDEKGFLYTSDHSINQKTKSSEVKYEFPKRYSYQLIARYPHDTSAFTQGLVFYNDNLYESTGLLGESGVRKINLNEGRVLIKTQLPDIYFGEGLTIFNHQLIQMSWKTGKVFFFHPETLHLIKKMNLEKEVWGSTTIENQLVISDGSSVLFFLDPENFNMNKRLHIVLHNKEITGLNELEYVEGYLYANIWPTNCIVKIDPNNGRVLGWLDLSALVPTNYKLPESAVLNGIAYQKKTKHVFITGKFWPFIYEIKLDLLTPQKEEILCQ
jgi:glutamine cyclotransferase